MVLEDYPYEDSSDDEAVKKQLQEENALKKQKEENALILAMQLEEGEDYEEYYEAHEHSREKRQKKTHDNQEMVCKEEETKDGDVDDSSDTDEQLKKEDILGKYAFCCKVCICPPEKKKKYRHCLGSCANSGNRRLYHRGCCHNDRIKGGDDYLSPVQSAIQQGIDRDGGTKEDKLPKPLSHLQQKYNTARSKETEYENEEDDIAIDSRLETNPDYINYRQQFQARVKTKAIDRSLKVLDLFSGIGSTAVILKRLKIPFDTIVHIEHDPVARYVSQFNHKDDGISHVYYECFDETFLSGTDLSKTKLATMIRKHGPFDLVFAGAPCQNYSEVNAYRKKNNGNAKYLPLVGDLVKELDSLQAQFKHEFSNDIGSILFLSENVVFKEYEKIWTHYGRDEHGLCPIRLDAKDFSPTARNRLYWTNVPLEAIDDIKNAAMNLATPKQLLDDGYIMVAEVCQTDSERECMTLKANSFMASLFRIDDDRMMRLKRVDDVGDTFYCSTYSVREREIMLGYPVGYVENALRSLYEDLTQKAFMLPEHTIGKTYKHFLDENLWHFVKCCYKFAPNNGDSPFFQIKISGPKEGKKDLSFFDEQEYCKHLLGNAWSIPVVEHIMKPIQKLFADETLFKQYKGFDYIFPWPPYNDQKESTMEV